MDKDKVAALSSKLANKFGEKLDFYSGWIANPKAVGAIAPTSTPMARIMASAARCGDELKVLELGPGNGVTTRAILEHGVAPENLTAIEFTKSFLPGLRLRYPGVNFIHGDAFNISHISDELGIEKFDTAISGLPLLNFPIRDRIRLVERVLDQLEPGRPLIQFSYGIRPPVRARHGHFTVTQLDSVLLNLPPARIWAYRRVHKSDS
jgi:phosphatidylethanolamine/phosphatidyl-N-methylethanolamine N-methyltransferase